MKSKELNFKYSWVLFDADHTLFDFDRAAEKSLALTSSEFGMNGTFDYAKYHVINRMCWEAYERGEIDRETLKYQRFERFFEAHHIHLDPIAFHDRYISKLASFPIMMDYAREILSHLHGQVQMAIVTNGLPEVQRPRLKNADLTHRFDVIVVAGEVGLAKPDPAYFDLVFDEMGNPQKSDVIIVGDSPTSDIKGGVNYGIDTCWFNPTQMENRSDVQPTFEIRHLKELHHILEH